VSGAVIVSVGFLSLAETEDQRSSGESCTFACSYGLGMVPDAGAIASWVFQEWTGGYSSSSSSAIFIFLTTKALSFPPITL
jgi:hypothetical protein